jgi:hypothetical protein
VLKARSVHKPGGRRHGRPCRHHVLVVEPRQRPPERILTLALHQGGVVSTAQAERLGLTRGVRTRLLREGLWWPVGRGVYAVSGRPPDWDGLAWAGCLLGGEGARLGPLASARDHGLLQTDPVPVDVLVPLGRNVRVPGPWDFVQETAGVRRSATVGSPPRLTVEDTLLDLCGRGTETELLGWVTTALRERLTSPRRLASAAEERGRLRHRRFLMDLVGDAAAGAESPLEIRYLRDVERPHGLPPGRRQLSRYGLPFHTDVDYDPYALLVELDGRKGHEGRGRFRAMNRDNLHVLARRWTLRYGWFDVLDHPCAVAWQVAQVLVDAGWPDLPTRCRRCSGLDLAALTPVH